MNNPIVTFVDADQETLINSCPLAESRLIPRIGEIVLLPGEKGAGAGSYDVIGVQHEYQTGDAFADDPSPANLTRVTVYVRGRRGKSHIQRGKKPR
jgi:hypothetical protein